MAAVSKVAAVRLAIGLAQGVALYVLIKFFAESNRHLFAMALLAVLLAPLAAIQAATHLRPATLAAWTAAVVILSAGLGFYAVWRDPEVTGEIADSVALLGVFLSVALFIAQALIVAAAADGRRIASYATYFDTAWKQGVQAAASVAFVGAFWALLLMGAALFRLIGLKFFGDIIGETWFVIPATTLALATAIHVTDVRPGIVRGIRTLALTLLSWLLPILALIVAGFVISLPFTGLQKLWDTNFATALVLAVMAALVILINAAYQDGTPDNATPTVTRHSATVAAVLLVPLVIIAGYGLSLRVGQYGWTTDRIIAAACVLVASCYAVGYAVAVLRAREGWLKRLEGVNIATSFVVLAILFALFTPIADPARISVNSQMARLEAGKIAAQDFDLKYLRFAAGRYGIAALEDLKAGRQVAGLQELADEHLKLNPRNATTTAPTSRMLASNITVRTAGRSLPETFIQQNWAEASRASGPDTMPACLRDPTATCDALMVDLNADGADEVVIVPRQEWQAAAVFQAAPEGGWRYAAEISGAVTCEQVRNDMSGPVAAAAPLWHDLEVGTRRFAVRDAGHKTTACPDLP